MSAEDVWLLGVAMSRFGKHPGTPLAVLGAATALDALRDAGVAMTDIGLFAAGGVWVEARTAPAGRPERGRGRWPVAITVSGVFALLIGLPVLPVRAENALRPIDPQPVETYGWPAFVRQVTAVADTLPPGAGIFTSNYGEAGALTILGPDAGLQLLERHRQPPQPGGSGRLDLLGGGLDGPRCHRPQHAGRAF